MPPKKVSQTSSDVKVTDQKRVKQTKMTVKKTTHVKTKAVRQRKTLNAIEDARSPLSTPSFFRRDVSNVSATSSPPKSSEVGSRSLVDTPNTFNSAYSMGGSPNSPIPPKPPRKKNNGGRSMSVPNLMRLNSNTPSTGSGRSGTGIQLFINDELPTTKPLPAIKSGLRPDVTIGKRKGAPLPILIAHNRIPEGISQTDIERANWRFYNNFNVQDKILRISKGDSEVIREHIQWINAQIQKSSPPDNPKRQEVSDVYQDNNSMSRIAKSNFDAGDTLVVSLLKKNQSPINSPEEATVDNDFKERLTLLKGLLEQYNVKLSEYSDAYNSLSEKIKFIGNDLSNERLRSNNLNKQLIESTVQLQKSIDSANQLKSKYDTKFAELLAATSEVEILKTKVKELARRYSPQDQLKLQETLQLNTELEKNISEAREVIRKQNTQISNFEIEVTKVHEEHQREINQTKASHEELKSALNEELDKMAEELQNAQSETPDLRTSGTQTEEQQSCFRSTFWSCLTCCGLCDSKKINPYYR